MLSKTIAVIGPEASGSRLVAKTIALCEGVMDNWNDWDGTLWWKKNNKVKIYHRSIPSGPDKFIDNIKLLTLTEENLKIVFTTRDKNISKISRNNSESKHNFYIEQNKQAILDAQELEIPYYLFSYETFMLYKELYLKELLKFTGSPLFYIPTLIDGNKKYLR